MVFVLQKIQKEDDRLSGKKGMKIKNRKPMSQETRKRISETMKKKWKEKEYRESVVMLYD